MLSCVLIGCVCWPDIPCLLMLLSPCMVLTLCASLEAARGKVLARIKNIEPSVHRNSSQSQARQTGMSSLEVMYFLAGSGSQDMQGPGSFLGIQSLGERKVVRCLHATTQGGIPLLSQSQSSLTASLQPEDGRQRGKQAAARIAMQHRVSGA